MWRAFPWESWPAKGRTDRALAGWAGSFREHENPPPHQQPNNHQQNPPPTGPASSCTTAPTATGDHCLGTVVGREDIIIHWLRQGRGTGAVETDQALRTFPLRNVLEATICIDLADFHEPAAVAAASSGNITFTTSWRATIRAAISRFADGAGRVAEGLVGTGFVAAFEAPGGPLSTSPGVGPQIAAARFLQCTLGHAAITSVGGQAIVPPRPIQTSGGKAAATVTWQDMGVAVGAAVFQIPGFANALVGQVEAK